MVQYDSRLLLKINVKKSMEISQRPKWIALLADLQVKSNHCTFNDALIINNNELLFSS